tara:strand:+ start:867 stop:1241 length:375 start_codon:yes stop_codon:yes gene_type:complete
MADDIQRAAPQGAAFFRVCRAWTCPKWTEPAVPPINSIWETDLLKGHTCPGNQGGTPEYSVQNSPNVDVRRLRNLGHSLFACISSGRIVAAVKNVVQLFGSMYHERRQALAARLLADDAAAAPP